jgi:dTDP-4-dehydrorhamnose reductase
MDTNNIPSSPELWGGIECTINRVGNKYRDQLFELGHYARKSADIHLISKLNVKALRYPILWERYQPSRNETPDWSLAQEDLRVMRDLNIKPIVGLLHHGSGPTYTDLLDSNFSEKFAQYAEMVAAQFPWVDTYIPINEPLTTARFCGLYGHWHPHHHSDLTFAKILLNQLKAAVLAMKSIRAINPKAVFIQTEDLAKVHSTPNLKDQAEFENNRRWLTYDLLFAKVDEGHPLWNFLISIGIQASELDFFLQNTLSPDTLGLHYYLTSERFLDDRCQLYPHLVPGSNGKQKYIDVEAVRAGVANGFSVLLAEAWNRYQIPIAITEVQLACTREEQLRWFKEVWDSCYPHNAAGAQVVAVTAWSLLGAYDWNSLVTRNEGHYESGAFDVSGNVRPTALAKLLSSVGATGTFEHPLLDEKGWWHRHLDTNLISKSNDRRPLLIVGRNGTLATAFAKVCSNRGIFFTTLSKKDIDITNLEEILRVICKHNAWGIINASGFARVDDAELNFCECYRINTIGTKILALACKLNNIPFMTFSCDQVFDGKKNSPYKETDPIEPLNKYGLTKAWADELVTSVYPSALIIRTSAIFSPWDNFNFAHRVIDALKNKREFPVAKDVIVSPTYIPHMVQTALNLFIDEEKGVWHLTNDDSSLSWADFANELAKVGGYNSKRLIPTAREEMNWKAKRPTNSTLVTAKGIKLPPLYQAIGEYFTQIPCV